VRLPAFRFLIAFVLSYFVIAGLDPAIHAAKTLKQNFGLAVCSRTSAWTTGSSPVVTRKICRCLTTLARKESRRENENPGEAAIMSAPHGIASRLNKPGCRIECSYLRFPGAAQHEAKRNGALQTRDRHIFGAYNDPGSAVHRWRAAPRPGNGWMTPNRAICIVPVPTTSQEHQCPA
jgi:hypothetical protein